eukprot:GEMP01002056.1.p1 GENE.GEMP01002056.1~~GEMP01002056.1.p1  ORF type:complete len:1284 (+),score=309.45 GEMP01002056.1:124-3975(+)
MTDMAQFRPQHDTVKVGHRLTLRTRNFDNSQFPAPPEPRFSHQRNPDVRTGTRGPTVNIDEITFPKPARPNDNDVTAQRNIQAMIHEKGGLSPPFRPHGGTSTPPSSASSRSAPRSARPIRQPNAPLAAPSRQEAEWNRRSPRQAVRDLDLGDVRRTPPSNTREASMLPPVSSDQAKLTPPHRSLLKSSPATPPLPAFRGTVPPPSPPTAGASPPIPRPEVPPRVSSPHEAIGSTAPAEISESPLPPATDAIMLPASPVLFNTTSHHFHVQPEPFPHVLQEIPSHAVPFPIQTVPLIPVPAPHGHAIPVLMTPPPGAVRVVMTPPPCAVRVVMAPPPYSVHPLVMHPQVPMEPEELAQEENPVDIGVNVFRPVVNPQGSAYVLAQKISVLYKRREFLFRERRRRYALRESLRLWNLRSVLRRLQLEFCDVQYDLRLLMDKKREGEVDKRRRSRDSASILYPREKKCEGKCETQRRYSDSGKKGRKGDLQNCSGLNYAETRHLVLARSYALRTSAGLFFTLQKIVDKAKFDAFLALDEETIIRLTRASTRAKQLLLAPTARARACVVPEFPPAHRCNATDMRLYGSSARVSAMRYISRAIRRLVLRQLGSAFWTLAWKKTTPSPYSNGVRRAMGHYHDSVANKTLSPSSRRLPVSSELREVVESPVSHVTAVHSDHLQEQSTGDDLQRREPVQQQLPLKIPSGDIDSLRMSFGMSPKGARKDIDTTIDIYSSRSSVPWNVEEVDELRSARLDDDLRSATDAYHSNRTPHQHNLFQAPWGIGGGSPPIEGYPKPRTPKRQRASIGSPLNIPSITQQPGDQRPNSECSESQDESSSSAQVKELTSGPPSARLLRTNMWTIDNGAPLKNNILVGARNIRELKSGEKSGNLAVHSGKQPRSFTPISSSMQQQPKQLQQPQQRQQPREPQQQSQKQQEQDSPEQKAMERQAVCKLVELFMRPMENNWAPGVEHGSKPVSQTVVPQVKVSMDGSGRRAKHEVSPRSRRSPRSAPAVVGRMRSTSPRGMEPGPKRWNWPSSRSIVESSPKRKKEPSPRSLAGPSPKRKKEPSPTNMQAKSPKRMKESSPKVPKETESVHANRVETDSKASGGNDPRWRFSGLTQDSADTTMFWFPDGSTGDSATLRTSGVSAGTTGSDAILQGNTWTKMFRNPAAWARKMLKEPHFEVKTPDLSAAADGKYPQTFNVYDMPIREYNGLYRRVDTKSDEVMYINSVGRSMWKVGDEWFFCARLRGKPDIVSRATRIGNINEDQLLARFKADEKGKTSGDQRR